MKLLRYLVKGFREGPGIRLLHGDPVVFDVEQMEKKVANEVHRMCGLIRFSEMRPEGGSGAGILYSPIEPDNDIIEFLADHFCDRLKEEAFIIHDKRRGKALIYARNDWYIGDFHDEGLLEKTRDEEDYRRLWRGYFDSIAIKERTNPACQKRFMPVRYWKNLTEFSAV
jgi:probable DNA metabolism protein